MIVQKIKIYIQIYVINLFNLFEFIFTSKFKVREFALKLCIQICYLAAVGLCRD